MIMQEREKTRLERHKEKKKQSDYYSTDKESYEWMKSNNDPKKEASIFSMQERIQEAGNETGA